MIPVDSTRIRRGSHFALQATQDRREAGTDKDEHRTSNIEYRMGKDEGSSHSRFTVGFLKTNEDNVTLLAEGIISCGSIQNLVSIIES